MFVALELFFKLLNVVQHVILKYLLIKREGGRKREREGGGGMVNLRCCNLLHFQGIIQQRGRWKVSLNIVSDDHNTHVWIIEL